MIQYMSAREAAEKWNISQRRVSILCSEGRIPDVAMLGNMWIIPRNAEKPVDARMKRNNLTEKGNAHPFVKWAGGKGQLLDVLKANLPEGMGITITKYAEPFVGGGALLFALLNEYLFEEIYINDNNKELSVSFHSPSVTSSVCSWPSGGTWVVVRSTWLSSLGSKTTSSSVMVGRMTS